MTNLAQGLQRESQKIRYSVKLLVHQQHTQKKNKTKTWRLHHNTHKIQRMHPLLMIAKRKVDMLALSPRKDSSLKESAKLWVSATCRWKTRLFHSLQISDYEFQGEGQNKSEATAKPRTTHDRRCRKWKGSGPLSPKSRIPSRTHCLRGVEFVTELSCLWLEVDYEEVSKQKVIPLWNLLMPDVIKLTTFMRCIYRSEKTVCSLNGVTVNMF